MSKKIIIIGAGFAGLSAATFMSANGYDVTVLEKHATPGGRARQLKADGFTFDMGPSWYWMPDVFERYFAQFGKKVSDYYSLKRLDPSYRIYWEDDVMDVPADYDALKNLFESIEPGSAKQLDDFMREAKYKYEVGIDKLVHRPGLSLMEFIDVELMKGIFRLDVFNSMKDHVAKHFKDPKIKMLLEFPVLFLGAMADKIPALYSLMSYADIKGGTWYPEGGMYAIVEAMYQLAKEKGVVFHFDEDVKQIVIKDNKAIAVKTAENYFDCDALISGADYHFTETLLPQQYRNYDEAYWNKRVMAPSCLLYYVGLNKKLTGIEHHSLFFDADFDLHGKEIYEKPQWPTHPLFYVSCTSITDANVAPINGENLFILIPVAAGLSNDDNELREKYFANVLYRMEARFGQKIKEHIVYKKIFSQLDFVYEYNSFKGNAYGLANTLMQTSIFKPKCRNKNLKNLFYTGQLTVPGPGVPPSIISGEVVAKECMKALKRPS